MFEKLWNHIQSGNDEIEFLRAGEIADVRASNVSRLVNRNDVVPYTHRCFSFSQWSVKPLILAGIRWWRFEF